MSPHILDFYFPFVVFFYGATVTFVLNMPALVRLAEERLPQHMEKQLKSHRVLAVICLWVGTFWSLQNIWVGGPL